VLAELYSALGRAIDTDPIISAWLVNFSAFVLSGMFLTHLQSATRPHVPTKVWVYFVPSLVIFIGSALLAIVSSMGASIGTGPLPQPIMTFMTVIAVPVIEELLFRKRFSLWFDAKLSGNWAVYANALFFSWMHSQPTLQNLLSGKINLPLGPFLLGLFCAQIYRLSNKIEPSIAFHIACNSTVVIFSQIDARWLEWLQFLYVGNK